MCYRYVDDTMTKIHEYAVRSFSEHLNSIDQHIQFTSEEENNGTIPFLDTCSREPRWLNKSHSVPETDPYGSVPEFPL